MRSTVVRCGQSLGGQSLGGQSLGGQSLGGRSLGGRLLGGIALALGLSPGLALAQQTQTIPTTLEQALVEAYDTNPQLLQERANLRSVDENVPKALGGWRPTVELNGSGGYTAENERSVYGPTLFGPGGTVNTDLNRDTGTAEATITQPVFQGGKTRASVFQAENQVRAERANLIATEGTVFFNVISAYVGVIENRALVAVNENNVAVLQEQLESTQDRFRVGELTQTDVAQSEAGLAQGQSELETAKGNLQTALATYLQQVGEPAAATLADPQPLVLPVNSEISADNLAAANNPTVIDALFTLAASKNAVSLAFSALMPTVNVQASTFVQANPQTPDANYTGWSVTANLTVPLYQGGGEYATVRQAKQNQDAAVQSLDFDRRSAVQSASQAWETLVAAQAAITSSQSAVRANRIALEGTEREAIVGTATTLDVLQVQQNLLTAETTLVQNLASMVTASYGVAQAIGRLTARDLRLPVPYYDEDAYYNSVRDVLFGTGGPADPGNYLPPVVPAAGTQPGTQPGTQH
jgi:outer membrane protein